jgi:ABC-type hemin transport system ATPase subunit
MRYWSGGLLKILAFIMVVCSVMATLPRLNTIVFPDVPEPSMTFDCDDSTLYMYRHFQRLGIEATPILGNLNLTGEEYLDCNHIWLMVKSGGKNIAYDWGEPQFDKQYHEGYVVNLDYLLYAVADDINNNNT